MESLNAPVGRLIGRQSQEADDEEEDPKPVYLALTRDQHLVKTALRNLIPECALEDHELVEIRWEVSSHFSNIIYQFKKHLLPSLQERVWHLCDLVFGPDQFEKNEPPEFQAALEVLKELKIILDQIKDQAKSLWQPSSASEDPRSLFSAKNNRCELVKSKMRDILEMLGRLCEKYDRLFLISEVRIVSELAAGITWRRLIRHTRRVSDFIDTVINWFALSDLGVVQQEWQIIAEEVGDLLQHAVEFPIKNPGIQYGEPLRDLIPLIKLSRTFFKKLSRATPSETHHPIYQMSQTQLSKFIHSTIFFSSVLEEFISHLRFYPMTGDDFDEEPTFPLMEYFQPIITTMYLFFGEGRF